MMLTFSRLREVPVTMSSIAIDEEELLESFCYYFEIIETSLVKKRAFFDTPACEVGFDDSYLTSSKIGIDIMYRGKLIKSISGLESSYNSFLSIAFLWDECGRPTASGDPDHLIRFINKL